MESELDYQLRLAVEAKLLADVNATSGIQAAAGARPQELTKLEVAGYSPEFAHPAPHRLGRHRACAVVSTNAIEHQGLPYDPAARRLYGVPIVVSNAQAAGVAHALGTDARGTWTPTPRRRRAVVGDVQCGRLQQRT